MSHVITVFKQDFEAIYPLHHSGVAGVDGVVLPHETEPGGGVDPVPPLLWLCPRRQGVQSERVRGTERERVMERGRERERTRELL